MSVEIRISGRRLRALELRALAWQIKDIASEIGVHERTVRKWFDDPKVDAVWRRIKDVIVIEAKRILRAALLPAANKMVSLIKSEKDETAYKAALYVLRTFGLQPPNVSIVLEKKQITVMKGIMGTTMERADRDGGRTLR